MKVRLLSEKYLKSENLQRDFIEGTISDLYFSDEYVEIKNVVPFPIHFAVETTRNRDLKEIFYIFKEHYIDLDQDVVMNPIFWQTIILVHMRDYVLEKYYKNIKSVKFFKNMIVRKFDWENYIYKLILIVHYLVDNVDENEYDEYLDLIADNMDLFNYCIKYRLFRNDKFFIMLLKLIKKKNLSKELKAKIKHLSNERDERFGRMVLLELNKRYPIHMIHMVSFNEFESIFMSIYNELLDQDMKFLYRG